MMPDIVRELVWTCPADGSRVSVLRSDNDPDGLKTRERLALEVRDHVETCNGEWRGLRIGEVEGLPTLPGWVWSGVVAGPQTRMYPNPKDRPLSGKPIMVATPGWPLAAGLTLHAAEVDAQNQEDVAPAKPVRLCCPNCRSQSLSTLERLNGEATASGMRRMPNGKLDIDWDRTEIDWDSSTTYGARCRECGWTHEGPGWASLLVVHVADR